MSEATIIALIPSIILIYKEVIFWYIDRSDRFKKESELNEKAELIRQIIEETTGEVSDFFTLAKKIEVFQKLNNKHLKNILDRELKKKK